MKRRRSVVDRVADRRDSLAPRRDADRRQRERAELLPIPTTSKLRRHGSTDSWPPAPTGATPCRS